MLRIQSWTGKANTKNGLLGSDEVPVQGAVRRNNEDPNDNKTPSDNKTPQQLPKELSDTKKWAGRLLGTPTKGGPYAVTAAIRCRSEGPLDRGKPSET